MSGLRVDIVASALLFNSSFYEFYTLPQDDLRVLPNTLTEELILTVEIYL